MTKKIISFVGGGKVAKVLATLLVNSNIATIGGIYNANFVNAEKACQFIGSGTPCDTIAELPKSDILFITTPDDQIEQACNILIDTNKQQKTDGSLILLHCSGSQPSTVLKKAKNKWHAAIASIHPILSFGNLDYAINNFSGIYCAFEGDEKIYDIVNNLLMALGVAAVFKIDLDKKAHYHVSGMFPGCLTVALMKVAQKLYARAGVPEQFISPVIINLLETTLKNIKLSPSVDQTKFSGPLPRKDIGTVKKHLAALAGTDYEPLYETLILELLESLNDQNHFDEQIKSLF